jgi:hypothetical protein
MTRTTVAKTIQKQGPQAETSSSGELMQRSSLSSDPYGEVLALQGMVGNGAVNRLLRGGRSAVVQAKLTIGQPGDKYEQEADRVAEEVVRRMNNPQSEPLQRQPLLEVEDKHLCRKPTVQNPISSLYPVSVGDGIAVSPRLETTIQHARCGGYPLPNQVREPMERAFGSDFGEVRIHTGVEPDYLSRMLSARAFTVGHDIFFSRDIYNPDNNQGKKLIAHELTHVIQQMGISESISKVADKGNLIGKIETDIPQFSSSKVYTSDNANSDICQNRQYISNSGSPSIQCSHTILLPPFFFREITEENAPRIVLTPNVTGVLEGGETSIFRNENDFTLDEGRTGTIGLIPGSWVLSLHVESHYVISHEELNAIFELTATPYAIPPFYPRLTTNMEWSQDIRARWELDISPQDGSVTFIDSPPPEIDSPRDLTIPVVTPLTNLNYNAFINLISIANAETSPSEGTTARIDQASPHLNISFERGSPEANLGASFFGEISVTYAQPSPTFNRVITINIVTPQSVLEPEPTPQPRQEVVGYVEFGSEGRTTIEESQRESFILWWRQLPDELREQIRNLRSDDVPTYIDIVGTCSPTENLGTNLDISAERARNLAQVISNLSGIPIEELRPHGTEREEADIAGGARLPHEEYARYRRAYFHLTTPLPDYTGR